jgi:uncharacterized protein (DUF2141 family)
MFCTAGGRESGYRELRKNIKGRQPMSWARCGLSTVALFFAALTGLAQVPGSLTTTNSGGAPQDLFLGRSEAFLAGGPFAEPCYAWSFLSDGLYYFQVTDPTGRKLLSTDPISERAVRVQAGVVSSYEGTTHSVGGWNACGSLAVGLMPFRQAPGCTGAYLVWLTPAENLAGQPEEVDPICGDGCFHGFRPELSRAFVARVEDRRSCDRTFCVSGVKFDDRDGNGVRDSGEPGLGGVEIRVRDEETGIFFSTITFPDGTYRLCGLTAGRSFRVTELPPFGFSQTGPRDRRISRRVIARDLGYFIEFCERDISGLDFGNSLTPNAIGGVKFEDFDADGVRDAGEPGLPGVTIQLTPATVVGPTLNATTDAAGNFLFTEVLAGTYTLSEVVPTGFTQTAPIPPGTIAVTLASGGSSLNNVFGNFRGLLTGTVSGVKFNDVNGNGTRDAGEAGLSGVTITLRPTPQPIVVPALDRTVVTGADGSYTFTEVPLGSYILFETVPQGFAQTAPPPAPGTISVNLTVSQRTSENNLFGNRAVGAAVSGTKFNDVNGNGARDTDEAGIAGVTIRLTPASGTALTTTTDSSGNFAFTGLEAGSYTLSELVPSGFVQTAPPAPGTFPVTIATGQVVTGLLFGNREAGETGSISAQKILDLNGDGIQNGQDRPFEGIVFRLADSAGVIREATSGADGNVTFTNLPAGTYVLSEVLPAGFVQTFPGTLAAPANYTITLLPGQNATGFRFLNKC